MKIMKVNHESIINWSNAWTLIPLLSFDVPLQYKNGTIFLAHLSEKKVRVSFSVHNLSIVYHCCHWRQCLELATIIKFSLILRSDVYRGGLPFCKISAVVQNVSMHYLVSCYFIQKVEIHLIFSLICSQFECNIYQYFTYKIFITIC